MQHNKFKKPPVAFSSELHVNFIWLHANVYEQKLICDSVTIIMWLISDLHTHLSHLQIPYVNFKSTYYHKCGFSFW